jgi:hypothetical protein
VASAEVPTFRENHSSAQEGHQVPGVSAPNPAGSVQNKDSRVDDGPSCTASHLYLWGSEFESRPGHRQTRPTNIVYFLSVSGEITVVMPRSTTRWLPPAPIQTDVTNSLFAIRHLLHIKGLGLGVALICQKCGNVETSLV